MLIQIQSTVPYPFVIAADGEVEGQDLWGGSPAALVGFQDRCDIKPSLDLSPEDWWKDPQQAVKKYPVFRRADSSVYVSQTAITEVRVYAELNPTVAATNLCDQIMDLTRESGTVVGRIWREDGSTQYTLRLGTTETSYDTTEEVVAALHDAGYTLNQSGQTAVADLAAPSAAEVRAMPHIVALVDLASEERDNAWEAGLAHARRQHALALEILRTRWPDAAGVAADLSMHHSQDGTPRITHILDANNKEIHRVERADELLSDVEEALSFALEFADDHGVGWNGPKPRPADDDEEGPIYTLTFDAATPPPAPAEITRIDHGEMTVDGITVRMTELVGNDDTQGRTFEITSTAGLPAKTQPDPLLLNRYLDTLRTLPELESELRMTTHELDTLILQLTDEHAGLPLFTGHARFGHALIHPVWIRSILDSRR